MFSVVIFVLLPPGFPFDTSAAKYRSCPTHTCTHTHTNTQTSKEGERERERERGWLGADGPVVTVVTIYEEWGDAPQYGTHSRPLAE